jgi:hypothetical protein
MPNQNKPEMTTEEKVKADWPDAFMGNGPQFQVMMPYNGVLSQLCDTPELAWADAASKLPPAPIAASAEEISNMHNNRLREIVDGHTKTSAAGNVTVIEHRVPTVSRDEIVAMARELLMLREEERTRIEQNGVAPIAAEEGQTGNQEIRLTTMMGSTRNEWVEHIDKLFAIAIPGEDIPEAALLHGWQGEPTEADIAWAKEQIAVSHPLPVPPNDEAVALLQRVLRGQLQPCSATIHADADGPIYRCGYPKGHEGACETREERQTGKRRIATLEQDIRAFLDSDRAKPIPAPIEGTQKWIDLPDSQGYWWHWDGNPDVRPFIYGILFSGTNGKYFIEYPDSRFCETVGGKWTKVIEPSLEEGGREER